MMDQLVGGNESAEFLSDPFRGANRRFATEARTDFADRAGRGAAPSNNLQPSSSAADLERAIAASMEDNQLMGGRGNPYMDEDEQLAAILEQSKHMR